MAWYAKFQDIEGTSPSSTHDADTLVFDNDREPASDEALPKIMEASAEGKVGAARSDEGLDYILQSLDDGTTEWANADGIISDNDMPETPIDDYLF